MICSSTELGLPKLNDGIMILDSSIGELEASKTLQFYLNKISDARFLIITDDEKSEVNEILIGKTNRIVNVDYTKLAEDDTLIKTTDSKILLTEVSKFAKPIITQYTAALPFASLLHLNVL